MQTLLDDLIQASSQRETVKAPNGEPIHPLVYKSNRFGPAIPTLILTSLDAPENKKTIAGEFCEWDPDVNNGDSTYIYGGLPYKVSRANMCHINSLLKEIDRVNHKANDFLNLRADRAIEVVQGKEREQNVSDFVGDEMERRNSTQAFNGWILFLQGIVFALWVFTALYLALTRRETIRQDAIWYLLLPIAILVFVGHGYLFMKDFTVFLGN